MAHRIALARSVSVAFLAASALSSAALVGCSGGAGDGGSSGDGTTESTQATLSPQGFAVETAPARVTATSVIFPTDAEVQSFRIGDVIAAKSAAVAMATPYIRTITAIAPDSPAVGQTTFTTTVASLDQLLDDAELDQTVPVTDSASTGAATANALVLDPAELIGLPNGGGKEWDLGNDGDKGAIALTGGGSVDFRESSFRVSGGVNFAYSTRHWYDPLPKHLRLVLSGGINARLGAKVSAHAAVDYDTPEVEYADIPLGTIVVTAGPIPIPIVISLKFSGSASVGLDGAASLHEAVGADFKMEAGFDYTESGGVKGVSSITHTFSHDPLTLDADVGADFRLYPLNTEVDFQLFDVAGPYLGVNPYLGVQATTSNEEGPKVEGIYGAEIHTGGQLAVLHHTLARFDVELADIQGTFPLCGSSDLVCGTSDTLAKSETVAVNP